MLLGNYTSTGAGVGCSVPAGLGAYDVRAATLHWCGTLVVLGSAAAAAGSMVLLWDVGRRRLATALAAAHAGGASAAALLPD